jgi:hypothetical protein
MDKKHIPVTWPKPYLLKVYERAVAEGCVRIPLPTQKHATSFAQAFYRLRRRSDAQHASFILPEYHLVTCAWEGARGTLLVTFNALPDGTDLPQIMSVESTEVASAPVQKDMIPFPETMQEEEFDPEKFVADLVTEAGNKLLDELP